MGEFDHRLCVGETAPHLIANTVRFSLDLLIDALDSLGHRAKLAAQGL